MSNSMAQDWANLNRYKDDNKKLIELGFTNKRVVFMGNSITESWLKLHPIYFSNKPYVNRGISGQTTPQMLLRFRQDVVDLNPATVVILAGINDIAENTGPITIEMIASNIYSMVELAESNEIKVILCSVLPAKEFPWKKGAEPADKIVKLNQLIEEYAQKKSLKYINYYRLMVDEDKGLKKELSNDGVHPTIKGYEVMESLLNEMLLKEL